jgi:hypothetical protein
MHVYRNPHVYSLATYPSSARNLCRSKLLFETLQPIGLIRLLLSVLLCMTVHVDAVDNIINTFVAPQRIIPGYQDLGQKFFAFAFFRASASAGFKE